MGKTWVQSLGWEDPPEEDMATHASIPAWRIPMDRGAWRATVHGINKPSDGVWMELEGSNLKSLIFFSLC